MSIRETELRIHKIRAYRQEEFMAGMVAMEEEALVFIR